MTLSTLRQRIVTIAEQALKDGTFTTYEEVRPVPLNTAHPATDCSGAVIWIYKKAGAPDPSGLAYTGYGNTGSFYSHCEHVAYENCEAGDMIDVAQGDGTTHVYLVLERVAGDLVVFSNGGPGAAKQERLSSVKAYWYGKGYRFQGLRELPLEDQPKHKYVVLNGRGERIGRCTYRWVWASAHRRMLNRYGTVTFKPLR